MVLLIYGVHSSGSAAACEMDSLLFMPDFNGGYGG